MCGPIEIKCRDHVPLAGGQHNVLGGVDVGRLGWRLEDQGGNATTHGHGRGFTSQDIEEACLHCGDAGIAWQTKGRNRLCVKGGMGKENRPLAK